MKPSELFTDITQQTGLYNIQAIDNIPSIMQRGLLSNERAAKIKHKSIAMQEVQQRRDTVNIPNGMPLHQYANVYFDPRNPMLYLRKNKNSNICILKFDRSILDFEGAVVSDRNASSNYASFYPPEIGLKEINFDLVYAVDWTDDNKYEYFKKKSMKCAEVLIPYKIPFDYVMGAAVVDTETKRKLEDTGFNRKIFVSSELFF
jgi:hypothetical protein